MNTSRLTRDLLLKECTTALVCVIYAPNNVRQEGKDCNYASVQNKCKKYDEWLQLNLQFYHFKRKYVIKSDLM